MQDGSARVVECRGKVLARADGRQLVHYQSYGIPSHRATLNAFVPFSLCFLQAHQTQHDGHRISWGPDETVL